MNDPYEDNQRHSVDATARVAAGRHLAELAEGFCRQHEEKHHDGETCLLDRAGVVAFLAHRLGVRDAEGIRLTVSILLDYERHHEEEVTHEH